MATQKVHNMRRSACTKAKRLANSLIILSKKMIREASERLGEEFGGEVTYPASLKDSKTGEDKLEGLRSCNHYSYEYAFGEDQKPTPLQVRQKARGWPVDHNAAKGLRTISVGIKNSKDTCREFLS